MAYTFAKTAGTLPPGLTLATTGVLSGTPTTPGTYNFTVTVTDSLSYTASQAYTVVTFSIAGGSGAWMMLFGIGGPGVATPTSTVLTNTVVASNVNPTVAANAITFTAAVAPAINGQSVPTGTVTFSVDGTPQSPSVALVNGIATLTLSSLTAGTHSITAAYSGQGLFAASTSPTLSQVANGSFTTPFQPGIDVTNHGVGGISNLVDDNSTNNSLAFQQLYNHFHGLSSASGYCFKFPKKTTGIYLFNGDTSIGNELQGLFFFSAATTFTVTFSLPSGTRVTTAAITYSATPATLTSNVLSAINTVLTANSLSSGLIGVTSVTVGDYGGGEVGGVYLTYSGSGYTGLPQAAASCSYVSSGVIRLIYGGAMNFGAANPPASGGMKSFQLVGDVDSNGNPATQIKTTVANGVPMFAMNTENQFGCRNIQFLAPFATGVGFFVQQSGRVNFENCYFSGFIGCYAQSGWTNNFRKCSFIGNGTAGSIGLVSQLATGNTLDTCTITGWGNSSSGDGIRASNVGCSIIRSTISNCHNGLNLGPDLMNGTQRFLSRSYFSDLTIRDNDFGIVSLNVSVATLNNVTITGSTLAPSGQSVVGLDINNNLFTSGVNNLKINGSFSTAGLRIVPFAAAGYLTFYNTSVTNSGAGVNYLLNGVSYSTPPAMVPGLTDVTFVSSPLAIPSSLGTPAGAFDQTAYVITLANWTQVDVTNHGIPGIANLVDDNSTDNTTPMNQLIGHFIGSGTVPQFLFRHVTTGLYLFSGTLTFSALPVWSILGEAYGANGVTLICSTSGVTLLKADYTSTGGGTFLIDCINVTSSGTNGIGAVFTDAILACVNRTEFSAGVKGIRWINPTLCYFNGTALSSATPCIAVEVTGCNSLTLYGCDISSVLTGEAIRVNGTNFWHFGGRHETCVTALNLGVDDSGNPSLLTNSVFAGITTEQNATFIDLQDCQGCYFLGIGGQGSAGSLTTTTGIITASSSNCIFVGCTMAGAFTSAGTAITVASGCTGMLFVGCAGANGNGTNIWSIATGTSTLVNCWTPTISFSPSTLPGGTHGTPYSQTVTASGGVGSVAYSVSSGTIPTGLTLNSSTGVLSGTPSSAATFDFNVTATDSTGAPNSQVYEVVVS